MDPWSFANFLKNWLYKESLSNRLRALVAWADFWKWPAQTVNKSNLIAHRSSTGSRFIAKVFSFWFITRHSSKVVLLINCLNTLFLFLKHGWANNIFSTTTLVWCTVYLNRSLIAIYCCTTSLIFRGPSLLKIDGFAMAPRDIITPLHQLNLRNLSISSNLKISPLWITGIFIKSAICRIRFVGSKCQLWWTPR